jgi:hypothetical protein
MNTRLIQIVASGVVGPSATVVLPHQVNINGTPQKPDFVAADASGFTISVTDTDVSITNNGGSPASVNVWLELKHTIERELGLGAQTTSLVPRPFVAATGGGGGNDRSLLALPASWSSVADLVQNTFTNFAIPGVSRNAIAFTAMRPGTIVGISTVIGDVITAGSVETIVSINGGNTGFTLTQTSVIQPRFGFTTTPVPQPYAAGDQIGINVLVSADFQPTARLGMMAWLEVVEMTPP